MQKHILFIVENSSFPADVRVSAEAEAAKEFGYEVTVISPTSKMDWSRHETIDGIEIYRHPMVIEANSKLNFIIEYANALMWEIYLGWKIFIKKRFHIIHGANPPDHLFVVALLFKVFGTKYIFDHHDLTPEIYLAKFNRKDILYKILVLMEKLNFGAADIVISTNESYKRIAMDRGKKKEEEVFVVRNGPRLDKIIRMPPNPRWKGNFEYLVVYLGAIGSQEGIDVLLRIAKYIVHVKEVENIKFIIMGTGTHWEEMVTLSQEMDLQKYVTFTGFVQYEEFYEILATADICVNPELKNDYTDKSTMIKIMDYMSFAKPIVQFDVTEGKVTAGDASIYVKDNDEKQYAETIINLLKYSKKRKEMGDLGFKRITDSLNWGEQKRRLKEAYDYLYMRG
jgi:glycosyltransferase involved in cell wall biosynthesis